MPAAQAHAVAAPRSSGSGSSIAVTAWTPHAAGPETRCVPVVATTLRPARGPRRRGGFHRKGRKGLCRFPKATAAGPRCFPAWPGQNDLGLRSYPAAKVAFCTSHSYSRKCQSSTTYFFFRDRSSSMWRNLLKLIHLKLH